jgi:hypothetical protein
MNKNVKISLIVLSAIALSAITYFIFFVKPTWSKKSLEIPIEIEYVQSEEPLSSDEEELQRYIENDVPQLPDEEDGSEYDDDYSEDD